MGKKKLKKETKQNKTTQKRRKKHLPGVEPRTSCMQSPLLLYCATSHHTNCLVTLIYLHCRILSSPTDFIQFKDAKLLEF